MYLSKLLESGVTPVKTAARDNMRQRQEEQRQGEERHREHPVGHQRENRTNQRPRTSRSGPPPNDLRHFTVEVRVKT